ncbi:putative membrane protein [Dehalobacter sp. UNSWDHB]|jgi:spore germination protein (amino acid permease)|nr:spore germination protein (amino acid permease) [Dehalobacter sp. DCA]AFV06347.1 spore germination protein (amino acid permease) [Dehalobacter sp. CF]EQB21518.1 putative membrane protein [Dehalobacter sp. UNSWDHB]
MISALLLVPGLTAEKAKQSAWIAVGLASLPGFFCLWIVWKLGKRFPNNTLPEYAEIILGKALGKVVGGAYILFFLLVNILSVCEFSKFLTVCFMPQTPAMVFNVILVLIGAYAASRGIEVIARAAQFVFPLFVISLLILFVSVLPVVKLGRLLPFLEGGIEPVIWGSVPSIIVYGEVIILAVLLSMVNKPEEVKRKGAFALLAAAIFLSAGMMFTLMIFGPNLSGELLFPFWFLSKSIEFSSYLQRVEGIIALLWMVGIIIKIAVLYYLVCFATAKTLGLKSYNPVVYPMALVYIPAATFLFRNTAEFRHFLELYWPYLGFIFELVLPLILLLVAVIRKKHRRVRQ